MMDILALLLSGAALVIAIASAVRIQRRVERTELLLEQERNAARLARVVRPGPPASADAGVA